MVTKFSLSIFFFIVKRYFRSFEERLRSSLLAKPSKSVGNFLPIRVRDGDCN